MYMREVMNERYAKLVEDLREELKSAKIVI